MSFRKLSALVPFTAPRWAAHLPGVPQHTLTAAQVPTPLHEWRLHGLGPLAPPAGFALGIKRDDLTGAALSGNKIRKLNFLLADAIQQGCDTVITCGGLQSNHARATAVLARQLGLNTHLVLRSKQRPPQGIDMTGNLLLDMLVGARIHVVPPLPYEKGLRQTMERIQQGLRDTTGAKAYLIPVGGSNVVGLWGYLTGFAELIAQDPDISDVVMSCGSGGTACGLALANYLTGGKVKIHAITVCDDEDYFHNHVDATLDELGLKNVRSREILHVVDGFKGQGYGLSTSEELKLLHRIARTSGILLDPTYTLKGARGLLELLHRQPDRFAGRRVVFLHTGGIHGLHDGRMLTHLQPPEDNAAESKSPGDNKPSTP